MVSREAPHARRSRAQRRSRSWRSRRSPARGPERLPRSCSAAAASSSCTPTGLDGSSTHEWTLVNGTRHLPVRMPAGVWADPGTPVRLEGTMRDGTLVLSDSATAVAQLGLSPLEAGAHDLAAAPSMHSTAVILAGFAGGPAWTSPANPDNPTATSLMFDDPSVTPGSLNAYYLDATYGQIGFQGTVFGP